MVQKIIRTLHRIVAYGCFVGTIVILILMLLTVGDVTGRSFFNSPITGTYEISGYMLAIITMLSFGYAQQAESMVRVEFFTDKMSKPLQAIFSSAFTLVTIVIFCLIVWQGYLGSIETYKVKTASDILHIPAYPFQFLVVIGALLLVIELVLKLIANLKSLKTGVYTKTNAAKETAAVD